MIDSLYPIRLNKDLTVLLVDRLMETVFFDILILTKLRKRVVEVEFYPQTLYLYSLLLRLDVLKSLVDCLMGGVLDHQQSVEFLKIVVDCLGYISCYL